MGSLTFKEALLKTAQATKDYIDDKITPITEELNQSNYNIINNGKFQNCYAHTYDMVPSWICDDGLGVWEPRSGGGWRFLNTSSTPGDMKGIRQNINLEKDTTYTLSFKADWQKNVNQDMEGYIYFYDNGWGILSTITIPIANNELNFNDIQTFTFTTPTDFVNCEIKFYFGENIGSGGSYTMSSVHEVKLEKGDTYTGWKGSKKDEGPITNGANLIQNGDFSSYTIPTTIDGWEIGGDGWIWDQTGQEPYNKEGCIYFANIAIDDVYSGFYQDIYNLKKRTEYTLTFYIDWESNVSEFYVHLAFYDINSNRLSNIDLKPSHAGTWSYTFVTPDIDFRNMTVGFCHQGIKEIIDGGFLGIAGNVKLTERLWGDDLGTLFSNYTTKTELEQTAEDFAFRIAKSGSGNILKNSLFKDGKRHWDFYSWDDSSLNNIDSFIWAPNSGDWSHGIRNTFTAYMGVTHSGASLNCIISSAWSPVTGNETYSYSFYHRQHRCHAYIEIKGLQYDGNYRTIHAFDLDEIVNGQQDDRTFDLWGYNTGTFTIPSDIHAIQLWIVMTNHNEEDQLNCYFWLAEPCIVRGSTPMHWVPHESEIYDGIVKIDNTGIVVQHDNTQTIFDNQALKFYEGDELYSKVDGGIFKVMNPGDGLSTIGSMGRFKWVNTGTCCTCLGAGLGHDVAIGSVRASGEATTCSLVDSSQGGYLTGSSVYYEQGLNINRASCILLNFRGDRSVPFSSQSETEVGALTLWGATGTSVDGNNSHIGCMYGRDCLQFGIAYGPLKLAMEICETANASNNTAIHMYGPLNMHGYAISNAGWTNPVSASSEYTSRLLNEGSNENINYGTLSYYEGEIRWCWKETVFTYAECDIDPETDEWVYTGRNICYVELPIFMAESIQNDYHINISKMSWGDYRIVEKNPYYFIIESQEEDFAFTFEVVAKLIDSETLSNNVSISSMSTTANPAVNVEPPTTEEIILPGSENIWQSAVVEDVEDNLQENINIGEE